MFPEVFRIGGFFLPWVEKLGHDVGRTLVLSDVVDRHDVPMVECGCAARFALENERLQAGLRARQRSAYDVSSRAFERGAREARENPLVFEGEEGVVDAVGEGGR